MIFGVSKECTLPFPRDLLIHAARMRARGISWGTIAQRAGHSAAGLARLPFDHPEIWEPLYERAEKLALQEAEGEGLKALGVLLEGEDARAAEKAARELLVHRRHIERQRNKPPRRQEHQEETSISAAHGACLVCESCRDQSALASLGALAVEDTPEELRVPIIQLACCRAQGEDLLSTAAEIGHDHEEVARWPFLYVKDWDRCWPTARLEIARFYAARAVRKLTDLSFDPDRNLAARAARTLLIHRRHMHWANQPQSAGEGAGTYPSSMTQGLVAIPGEWRVATDVLSAKEFAKVIEQRPPRPRPGSQAAGPREEEARESAINRREHKVSPDTGPRSCGAVRPFASVASVSSVVRARDGPG